MVTWNPQWCQEFAASTAGPPDTTVWSFDLGNGGFGNNEIETYCGPPGYAGNPSNCPTTFATSTSNAYFDGSGHLVIQVINNGGTWFSARMKTLGLENFQYGRIEASIRIPDTTNPGLWPAFWSLGSNINSVPWPACGEVDFMENWSPQVLSGPGPGGNKTTLHTTVTGGNGIGALYTFPSGQQADTRTPSDLSSGDTWPFNAQLFLLMNVAVGGTLGGSTTNTPSPDLMLVDYVRQYQPAAAVSAPVMGTPPSITVKAGATTGNSSAFTPGLTSSIGFAYFSCTTNAPKASCAISTNDPLNRFVTNSSATPAETVTVSVTTTANTSAATSIPALFFFNPRMRTLLSIATAAFLVLMIVALAQNRQRRSWVQVCTLVVGLILTAAVTLSCGGSGGGQIIQPGNNGTPPGSYTVTVYAFTESNVSNGANSNADANVAIPLTVN
jgi:beta-glucanase (GH16 family)